jgi:hypothetical protein
MSDGQFSSKPMRSGQQTDLTAGYPSGSGPLPPDQARAFVESRAVRHEIDGLLDDSFLDSNRPRCAPLPRNVPDAAEDMGQPIASAVLVQEYLIGLLFLRVAGWIFLPIGVLIVLGAVISFFSTVMNPNQHDGIPIMGVVMMAGFGLGIGAVGAWFGIFRGRVITERCWLCTHGVVWLTNNVFDWYSWADVPEVYYNLDAPRPAVGIRFDRNLSWISFSNTADSRRMVKDIERHASASRLPTVLRRLAEGETIVFGGVRLNRQWLANGPARFHWHEDGDVQVQGRSLMLREYRDRELVTIPLEETPFPSLFTVLARAIVAHARERAAL